MEWVNRGIFIFQPLLARKKRAFLRDQILLEYGSSHSRADPYLLLGLVMSCYCEENHQGTAMLPKYFFPTYFLFSLLTTCAARWVTNAHLDQGIWGGGSLPVLEQYFSQSNLFLRFPWLVTFSSLHPFLRCLKAFTVLRASLQPRTSMERRPWASFLRPNDAKINRNHFIRRDKLRKGLGTWKQ